MVEAEARDFGFGQCEEPGSQHQDFSGPIPKEDRMSREAGSFR